MPTNVVKNSPMAMCVLAAMLLCGSNVMAAEAPSLPAPLPDPTYAAACEKATKTWLDKTYAGGTRKSSSGRVVSASYKTLFGAKTGQCLVRVDIKVAASGKAPAISTTTLYQGPPAEKRPLGSLTISGDKLTHCDTQLRRCQTAAEWQDYVARLVAF